MSRVDQINELLRKEIAEFVAREVAVTEFLITIVNVKCTSDLKKARVNFSCIPDRFAGSALRDLRSHLSAINNHLSKKMKFRTIPKLSFYFDPTEKEATILEEYMNHIEDDNDVDVTLANLAQPTQRRKSRPIKKKKNLRSLKKFA